MNKLNTLQFSVLLFSTLAIMELLDASVHNSSIHEDCSATTWATMYLIFLIFEAHFQGNK